MKTQKKLALHRETLRSLETELKAAAGGGKAGPTAIDCSVTCLAPDQTSFTCR